jgi:DNA-binding winged helix-turn-helix (wHTH) protein/tetratricopeptide (TPR) repeat protein
LRLSPPTRELRREDDGRRQVLEPRVMQVLLALAQARGEIVTRDALTQSCWQGRVVGEDAINRVISRLRQAAREIGDGVFHIETVTQVGYRLVSDFSLQPPPPPAPGMSGRRSAGVTGGSPTSRRWRRTIAAIFGLAVLAGLAGAGAWWWGRPAAISTPRPSRAQLRIAPFTVLSPDVTPAFAAQATEEIVAAFGLTGFVDITTAPPQGKPGPLAWTLTGAIGRSGASQRFVMHLTHDSTGQIVWSGTLDRPVAEGDRALKAVAAALEEILATSLSGAARYQAQGHGPLPDSTLGLFILWNGDTVLPVGRYRHGEEELRRAVAQTPDFADGWLWLAGALGATATASDDPVDAAAARAEAPAVIAKALSLRPHDPVALMARAKTLPPGDFLGRDAAFLAAIAQPTSEAGVEHSAYSVFLMNVGRLHEAVRQADIGFELDPLNPSLMNRYARALAMTGQTALAAKVLDQTRVAWPDDPGVGQLRIRSALWTGDYAAAQAEIAADVQATPAVRAAMAAVFAALKSGDPRARAAAAEGLVALGRDRATLTPFVASGLAALGRDEEALAAAERLIGEHTALAADVLFEPSLARARGTPAFAALAGRLGLIHYWRASGRRPDFCSVAAPPALCAGLKR